MEVGLEDGASEGAEDGDAVVGELLGLEDGDTVVGLIDGDVVVGELLGLSDGSTHRCPLSL